MLLAVAQRSSQHSGIRTNLDSNGIKLSAGFLKCYHSTLPFSDVKGSSKIRSRPRIMIFSEGAMSGPN